MLINAKLTGIIEGGGEVTNLKQATLFTSTPHAKTGVSEEAPERSRVIGSKGSRMVFSCTWNENRKNDIDEASRAYGSNGRTGVYDGAVCPVFVVAVNDGSLHPAFNNRTADGRNPIAVSPVENLIRVAEENTLRHLNMTLLAHQKLATLSSKSPLAKGKILTTGCFIPSRGAKGGRKGRKMRKNAAHVVRPSWIRCTCPLRDPNQMHFASR